MTIIDVANSGNGVSFSLEENGGDGEKKKTVEDPATCMERVKRFAKKYLLEGQKFTDGHDHSRVVIPPDADFLERFGLKHRKLIATVAPMIFFYVIWWTYAISHNIFPLYKKRWPIPVMMLAGSFIGGMTCEGGGSVSYPVMTLFLHIAPTMARDFSLMSQSVGMTAPAFTILYMGVAIEWHSIIFASFGAMFGVVLGIEYIEPLFSKEQKKMFFVSIWFAFACALFLLNRKKKRKTYLKIQRFCWWKACILVAAGFVGGVFTSFFGTGVCICQFSMLTLVFQISEKVATQTSIVLMAGQTMIGFFWRAKINESIPELVWECWKCTLPVNIVMGPLGGLCGSIVHRQTLAFTVYFLEALALATAFYIVRPNWQLTLVCIVIIVVMFFVFFALSRLGLYLISSYPDRDLPVSATMIMTPQMRENQQELNEVLPSQVL